MLPAAEGPRLRQGQHRPSAGSPRGLALPSLHGDDLPQLPLQPSPPHSDSGRRPQPLQPSPPHSDSGSCSARRPQAGRCSPSSQPFSSSDGSPQSSAPPSDSGSVEEPQSTQKRGGLCLGTRRLLMAEEELMAIASEASRSKSRRHSARGGSPSLFATALAYDNVRRVPDYGSLCTLAAGPDDLMYVIRRGVVERFHVDLLADDKEAAGPEEVTVLQCAGDAYTRWDRELTNGTTVRVSEDGACAAPVHRSTQGTVVGGVAFSEGVHQWRVQTSRLESTCFGLVGRLGLDRLTACRRGEIPPYVAALRPGPTGEHRLHWVDSTGVDHCASLQPPLSATLQPNDDGLYSLSIVVDFTHRLIIFLAGELETVVAVVDPVRQLGAGSSVLLDVLLDGRRGENQDSASGLSTGCPDEYSAALLGDHTVFCHLQSDAEARLQWFPRESLLPLTYADLDVQLADPHRVLCGNPHTRWGQIDSTGVGAAFRLPVGMCRHGKQLYVTDSDTIREVSLPDGAVTTHRLRVIGAEPLLELGQLGPVCVYAPSGAEPVLYVSDTANNVLLCVSTSTWEACIVCHLGEFGVRRSSDRRRRAIAAVLADKHSADCSNDLSPEAEQIVRRACCSDLDDVPSLEVSPFSMGVQGLAVMPQIGFLFIADTERHCVLLCDLKAKDPVVRNSPRVLCGVPGEPGNATGFGDVSRLCSPTGIVADEEAEVVYVSDTGNKRVCKLSVVWSTTARSATAQLAAISHSTPSERETDLITIRPVGLALHSGCLWVAEPSRDSVWQVLLQQGARASGSSFLAPVERLTALLRQAKRQADAMPVKNVEHARTLQQAIEIITSIPNIYEVKYVGGPMDENVAKFLIEEYKPAPIGLDDGDTIASDDDDECSLSRISRTGSFLPGQVCKFGDGFPARGLGVEIDDIDELSFDVFDATERCEPGVAPSVDQRSLLQSEGVLLHVAYNVMVKYQFSTRYFCDQESRHRLVQFLMRIQQGYHADNPYHNDIHAADVLQTLHWMLNTSGIADVLSDVDLLAVIVAAAVHDYDHPGVNNGFLVSTQHDFALQFNDQSVLENYHTQHAFRVLGTQACDITMHLSRDEKRKFRDDLIAHVLGTDMKHHFPTLGVLRARLQQASASEDGLLRAIAADNDLKTFVLKVFLHAADISNPAKPTGISTQWSVRVMREFRLQGVMEEERSLAISPFMGPNADIAQCQKGFIEFVVRPLFEILAAHFPGLQPMLDNVDANLAYWKESHGKHSNLQLPDRTDLRRGSRRRRSSGAPGGRRNTRRRSVQAGA